MAKEKTPTDVTVREYPERLARSGRAAAQRMAGYGSVVAAAARRGASEAARTARAERARRSQPDPPWWRKRWVIITAGGAVIASAAGGAYAVLRTRRRQEGEDGTRDGLTNRLAAGKTRMADATRQVVDRLRNGGPDQAGDEGEATRSGTGAGDPRRTDTGVAGAEPHWTRPAPSGTARNSAYAAGDR